jgi:hypothetical protein
MKRITRCLLLSGAIVACVDTTAADESMYLTGTEEAAVTMANGQPACTNPKKQLVCHIPPGNPANAHEICVGNAAVEPHVLNHGDLVGPCDPPDDGDDGDDGDDNNDPPPPPSDHPPDVIP